MAVAASREATPGRRGRKHVPTTTFAKLTIMNYEEIIGGISIVNSLSNSQETKFYNRKRKLRMCRLNNNNSFFSIQLFRCSVGGGGAETRTRPQTESGWGWHAKLAGGFP